MNRKRIILALVLTISVILATKAQEATGLRTPDALQTAPALPIVPPQLWLKFQPAPLTLDWLREETDPILKQKQQIRSMMEKRAQQSLIMRTQTGYDPNTQTATWSVGNTGVFNWSIYPDRALDARALRFPMRQPSREQLRQAQQPQQPQRQSRQLPPSQRVR